jgi:hypothetical protein
MEEEHARVEAALRAVNVKAEAEEKIERKRAQASAKKRAKREKAAAPAASTAAGSTPTASTGHLNAVGVHGGSNTASTCTPQPEQREQLANVNAGQLKIYRVCILHPSST